MQVNQVSDLVTHAVIGQNEAKAAQISQSAEFFNVLSNTLYSNKKLAVSREVLCNAWDIHIQQGILDKAVEIILTDDELSIRDFGTGIHDDHIVDVYLTYGNSTKKLDGSQTGGFGLGSKSPWAVVDHFKVESNHAGVQSVYQMSKSSGEVAGVPSAKKMYSLPTTLSGLCVSFALNGFRERAEYEKLIRMLVYFGEMNATLNGEKLDTLAFSEAPYKMLLVKRSECQDLPEGRTRSIFVRYGNVVYPIPDHEKLARAFNNITSDLQRLGRGDYSMGYQPNYVLVLQAKPNTISVTPSRESLSMTPKTVESLEELLINYQENFMGKMLLEMVDVAQKSIQTSWLHKSPADLLTSSNDLPLINPGNTYHKAVSSIATPREATVAYMLNQYPVQNGFHEKDVEMRLEALYVSGFGNKGKILSLLKAYRRTNTKKGMAFRRKRNGRGQTVDKTNWFQKVMIQPILAKMRQHPSMSPKNFVIRGANYDPRKRGYSDREVLTEASRYGAKDLESYMPFMSNFVVLAYNRTDVIDRLSYHPAIKNWFKSASDCMVYICSRTTGRNEEAREFFEGLGMYVIDLTKPMAGEHESVVMPAPKPVVAKPRKQGLVKLSQPNTPLAVDMIALVKDDAARIEKPELFIQMNLRASEPYGKDTHWINATAAAAAARLYGGKTGIVVNANQRARFTSLGVKEYWQHVQERVVEVATTSPAIKQMISAFPGKLDFGIGSHHAKLLAWCTTKPMFGKALGLKVPDMTKEEKMVLAVIRTLESNRNMAYYFPQDKLKTLRAYYDTIPVDPLFKKLAQKISNSMLLPAIDLNEYESVFLEYEGQVAPTKLHQKKQQGFLDLLVYAIEG